ncbi:LysR family transcriptional regulator [Pokkaliibacter sp. CJK22405]|uniref:LysR family transcriptional regulator n=1 Tax=Pokkaliibacter sp. CJK22405 TaxID=3384615 RepID=UPI0039847509
MFDLKELEAFANIIRNGSLTSSARELNLPKSTLSRRLKNLEEQLNQNLLRRESNRLIPTEAGLVFYRYSREILALAANGQAALEELKEEVSGELELHCHETLLRSWFTPLVTHFLEQHPSVQATLNTQLQAPGPELTGGVHIWLGDAPSTTLKTELLGRITQGLYGQPEYLAQQGHPTHPCELARHAWVDLLGSAAQGIELTHPVEGRYHVTGSSSRLRVDRQILQSDAIQRGSGIGLMPHWLVEKRNLHHPDAIVPCLPEWQGPELGVYLLYPYGHLSRRLQTFVHFVRQHVPEGWRSRSPALAKAS